MIIHYTKNAENKFLLLQKHGRQIFKEDVTAIVKAPQTVRKDKNLYFVSGLAESQLANWEVVYTREETVVNILTFYPLTK